MTAVLDQPCSTLRSVLDVPPPLYAWIGPGPGGPEDFRKVLVLGVDEFEPSPSDAGFRSLAILGDEHGDYVGPGKWHYFHGDIQPNPQGHAMAQAGEHGDDAQGWGSGAKFRLPEWARLSEAMQGWVCEANEPGRSTASPRRQPDINVPAYFPISKVDDEHKTVEVRENWPENMRARDLGNGVVRRWRIFAPPGAVTRGEAAGAGMDWSAGTGASRWHGAAGTRCLYKGYRYESPMNGAGEAGAGAVHRQQGLNFAGSYYTLHRHYDPTLMRFTSPDPLASPFYNLFSYAGNNPAAFYDPDGLWAMSKLTRLVSGDWIDKFSDAEIESVVGTDRDALFGASYEARNILTGKYGAIGLLTGKGLYEHCVSPEEFGQEYAVNVGSAAFATGRAATAFAAEATMVIATVGLAAPAVGVSRAGQGVVNTTRVMRSANTAARGSPQRQALLNHVRNAGSLSEAKGIVFTARQMQARGYELMNASLTYSGRQGIDLVFRKGTRFAVAEAKAGAGAGRYTRLAKDVAGNPQGSAAWNQLRLDRYLRYGDGRHNALARQLLAESRADRLRSFAGFYGNRRLVQLPQRKPHLWPDVPAVLR
jgi:RHS repeat-associated protein